MGEHQAVLIFARISETNKKCVEFFTQGTALIRISKKFNKDQKDGYTVVCEYHKSEDIFVVKHVQMWQSKTDKSKDVEEFPDCKL